MTVFLGAQANADGESYAIAVLTEPLEWLARGGLVSPIFGAFDEVPPELPPTAAILLLFPRTPRGLLLILQTNLNQSDQRTVFVSHGLASVGVVLSAGDVGARILGLVGEEVLGWELWPIEDGVLRRMSITRASAAAPPTHVHQTVDATSLPYDAAAQVRQFNATIAFISTRILRWAPEFADLLAWLVSSVDSYAEEIRTSVAAGDIELRNNASSALVEVNAGLHMLTSQLLAGAEPLDRTYPVAEYSLFGVGGVLRGLWGLYRHLSRALAESNTQTRLADAYDVGTSFPTFANRQHDVFPSWEASRLRLDRLAPPQPGRGRLHVLHFSSRYGFHETLNTMSASWQCVYASASRDWNLLTLSHEFLHAHVRELIALVLGRFTPEEISRIIEADNPQSPWESMAGAMVSAMHHAWRVQPDLKKIPNGEVGTVYEVANWTSFPTADLVRRLLDGPMRRYLQEMMVHVLDYRYVYDRRDTLYISSIWARWAFVPAVAKRLQHYVVRSLVALSTARAESLPAPQAFVNAYDRLRQTFTTILDAGDNQVVMAAKKLLENSTTKGQLELEFGEAYYMGQLARIFFFDRRIAKELQSDQGTAETLDGYPTYDLRPGRYPARPIASHTAFLLDRFPGYPSEPDGDATGRESLWQTLLLTSEAQ